jgi:hypothetical protein
MAYAAAHDLVVFTHDLDFGLLLAARKVSGPSVIQIRAQDLLPDAIGSIVLKSLTEVRSHLEAGARSDAFGQTGSEEKGKSQDNCAADQFEPCGTELRGQLVEDNRTKGAKFVIFGAHVIVYSKDATADRVFLREVLGFSSVDAGHGWLIFALPPAEVAVHPAEENERHELYFMCDDLKVEISTLKEKGVQCSDVQEARWGSITKIRLPGGNEVGLYQPKHPTALAPTPN